MPARRGARLETAPNRVLCGTPVRSSIGSRQRIPLFEGVAQVAVADGGADLEGVSGSVRPGHLLLLAKRLATTWLTPDSTKLQAIGSPCR